MMPHCGRIRVEGVCVMSNLVKWAIGIAAVAAFVVFAWWQSQPGSQFGIPEGEPQKAASAGGDTAPASSLPSTGETTSSTAPSEEVKPEIGTKPEPVVPEFDVVRVSPDGLTVIAGRAAPGQTVEMLLDGVLIATVVADANGQFATHLELPQSDEARQLVLRVSVDGAVSDDVAVSVLPDPQAVASAEQAAVKASEEQAQATAAAEEAERAAAEAQAAADRAADEAERASMEAEEAAERVATELAADAAAKAIAADIAAAEAEAKGGQATAQEEGAQLANDAERRAELMTESRTAEEAAVRAAGEAEQRAAEAKSAVDEAATKRAEADAATRVAADAAAAAIAAALAAAGSAEPDVARHIVSAPVIILPSKDATAAPVLVQSDQTGVTLLQPSEVAPASQITLDRISYSDAGAVVAAGRGRPGSVIRVYGNAEFLEQVNSGADGQWQVEIASGVANATQLLRFDAIDAAGNVVGRLETPFEYSPQTVAQELQEREIVVQKGDHLWKFATQHYGEGWRYSVIFSANSELIRDPDLIYPGQVFKVPELVQSQ